MKLNLNSFVFVLLGSMCIMPLLSGCSPLAGGLAHSASRGTGVPHAWNRKTSQIYAACSKAKPVASVRGQKSSCNITGVNYNLRSSSSDLEGTLISKCGSDTPPHLGVCEVGNGVAKWTGIYQGFYLKARKYCVEAINRARTEKDLWKIEFLVLDYGFEKRDKSKDDKYILSGGVILGVNTESMDRKVIRAACVVEDGQVTYLKLSDIDDMTQEEYATFALYGAFR